MVAVGGLGGGCISPDVPISIDRRNPACRQLVVHTASHHVVNVIASIRKGDGRTVRSCHHSWEESTDIVFGEAESQPRSGNVIRRNINIVGLLDVAQVKIFRVKDSVVVLSSDEKPLERNARAEQQVGIVTETCLRTWG